MRKTKSSLRIVNGTHYSISYDEDRPVKPYINNDKALDRLMLMASALEITIRLADRIYRHGERLLGLYDFQKQIIYVDKHLRGRDLQFVLLHEFGHALLHPGKCGERYWQDPSYRKTLEDEANDWATKILGNLRGPELAQVPTC